MAEPRARIIDDKKFMWDGRDYDSVAAADRVRKEYEEEGFETRLVEEAGGVELYTRRVVSHDVIEPPPVV